MNEILEVNSDVLDRSEERGFIEWMLSDLEREQLAVLLSAGGIKLDYHAITKLNKRFIRNKLLLKQTRVRLRDNKIFPPFSFLLVKDQELTKELIVKEANENAIEDRHLALMLFLQNHYEDALKLYDNRELEETIKKNEIETDEISKDKTIDSSPKNEFELKPKVRIKLQQKITTLTKEKEELLGQLQELKSELKESNREFQKQLNEINQELAKEKKVAAALGEDINKLEKLLEGEKSKNSKLLKDTMKKASKVQKNKKKIAIIGDPMNSSITSNEKYLVDIYEIETIDDFVEASTIYNYCYYLSYTIDEVLYENAIPENIRMNISRVDSYKKLKEIMGEL